MKLMMLAYILVCGVAVVLVFWPETYRPTAGDVVQFDDLQRNHDNARRDRVEAFRRGPAQIQDAGTYVRPAIFNLDYDAAAMPSDADPCADGE